MPESRAILELPAPSADARRAYGPGAYQFGDLRLPLGYGPFPVALGIHGGYWRARYGLDYFGHVCAALTAAGIATWNVEYRRLGNEGGGWPGTFEDVARAADFLRTLAASHPLDLTRVTAIGHSAGGQLALWLAGRHRIPPDSPLYVPDSLPLAGAVALAAVTDLGRGYELRLSDGVIGDLLGGPPETYPDRYAATSPFELLPLGVKQLLVTGDADTTVPPGLTRRYAAAARTAGDDVETLLLPGAGHFEVVDPRSHEWEALASTLARFIGPE